MKLISLKFKAFAAYLDEQFIDFSSFSDSGIFLVSGKTGAGKTAILDAITYALYGKSSGGSRGDIFAMRCQLATANDDTEVELIFEIRGKRYKFTRKLQQKRVNIQSSYNALYMTDDGLYMPFFENPHMRDIEQKATELIGLNYEQFRQVIILPQGQFEKLLVAKSDEKEKILVSLFGAEKWQKAAEKYSELVNEKKRQLENTKVQLLNILSGYGCGSVEELKELLNKKRAQSIDLQHSEETISEKYKSLNEKTEELFVIDEKFRSLSKLMERKEIINSLSEKMNADSLRIERSINAIKIKPSYLKAEETLKQRERRSQELKKQLTTHSQTEEKLKKAKEKLENLNAGKAEITGYNNKITQLESLREIFNNINSINEELKEKENLYKQHRNALNVLETMVKNLELQTDIAERVVLDKYTQYNILLTEYLNGMSGSLAKELKENMPCPVCGSKHHPNPAKTYDTVISQSLLDEKNDELEDAKKNRDEIKSKLEYEDKNLKLEQNLVNEKLLEIEKDRAIIENMKKGISSDISNLEELEQEIENYRLKIQDFENESLNAQNLFSSCETLYTAEKASIEFAEKEYTRICKEAENSECIFKKELQRYNYSSIDEYTESLIPDDELELLQKRVSEYLTEKNHVMLRFEEFEKDLEGVDKPDIESLRVNLKALEEELLDIRGKRTVLSSETSDLEKKINELNKKFKTYIVEEEQNTKDSLFAKRMRGDSGIGIQRYILGVVLSQITFEANRLLENVHNGRYRLLRTLEGSRLSRKTGLELEVYDSFTGERRGVGTLSGGEKFLVALSLSIGLSTVVQSESSGINIQTMFIDEGFGSLDPSSISDALTVLGKIKNSGSLIGIISHVDELKDNIDTQIEIKKERTGSRVVVHM